MLESSFSDPPWHQDGVVIIVVVVISALTKDYIGNALLKIPKHNIGYWDHNYKFAVF